MNLMTVHSKRSRKRQWKRIGARALRAIIEEFMLDIMYEIPKDEKYRTRVTITKEYIEGCGGPKIEIRSTGDTFRHRIEKKP